MYRLEKTEIPGCVELLLDAHHDERGTFLKLLHEPSLAERAFETRFLETYCSWSDHGVLRGMHFQRPPRQHAKLVCCLEGEVVDAVVDLRKGSPTFGLSVTRTLSGANPSLLYAPPGLAHGFMVTSERALMLYFVTSVHSPEHDAGILWNSAGVSWPAGRPLLSERDRSFPPLSDFESPFEYERA